MQHGPPVSLSHGPGSPPQPFPPKASSEVGSTQLAGAREWTSRSQSDGDDLGGTEGVKPVLRFLAHSALGPGPAAQPVGPSCLGPGSVTNASFGGGLMAPANLPVCSDFYPGCPGGKGVVTATFGHIQRNRRMLGAQPALPAHLAHGHQPQGTCHQNTVCSVKNKPSWAGQGQQVPEQGAAHMSKPL